MTMKLTRAAYQKLVEEDIEWLEKTAPRTLERNHLIEIARWSVDAFYPTLRVVEKLARHIHDGFYASQSAEGTIMLFDCRPEKEKAAWMAAARVTLHEESP